MESIKKVKNAKDARELAQTNAVTLESILLNIDLDASRGRSHHFVEPGQLVSEEVKIGLLNLGFGIRSVTPPFHHAEGLVVSW